MLKPEEDEIFPFTAIVGHSVMKRALLLNVINPEIGSILITGPRGIGKSTAVRGLTQLLQSIKAVEGCRVMCDPDHPEAYCSWCQTRMQRNEIYVAESMPRLVELPRNARIGDIVGGIEGRKVYMAHHDYRHPDPEFEDITLPIDRKNFFVPGIAADINRGILFIDNLNEVREEVVEVILRLLMQKRNVITQGGIQIVHPTEFVLIATTDSEEYSINPRLINAMSINLKVEECRDLEEVAEIMNRVREFESNPKKFIREYASHQAALKTRILKAKQILTRVRMPDYLYDVIARISMDFDLPERRSALIESVARTLCAYDNRQRVITDDIAHAAELVIPREDLSRYFLT